MCLWLRLPPPPNISTLSSLDIVVSFNWIFISISEFCNKQTSIYSRTKYYSTLVQQNNAQQLGPNKVFRSTCHWTQVLKIEFSTTIFLSYSINKTNLFRRIRHSPVVSVGSRDLEFSIKNLIRIRCFRVSSYFQLFHN